MFIAEKIGYRSNADIISWAVTAFEKSVIVIGSKSDALLPEGCATFHSFSDGVVTDQQTNGWDPTVVLEDIWSKTPTSDPCCFQFTSGTTGPRKASMLSHR